MSASRPLYPRKQTLGGAAAMYAKGHQRRRGLYKILNNTSA